MTWQSKEIVIKQPSIHAGFHQIIPLTLWRPC